MPREGYESLTLSSDIIKEIDKLKKKCGLEQRSDVLKRLISYFKNNGGS